MSDGAVTVEEFRALFRLRDALQSAESYDQILDAVCDVVGSILGVRRVSVQVFSAAGQTRFQASRGLSEPYRRLIEERWRSIFDASNPTTFVSPHLEGDDREPLWREIVEEGIRALISVPLVVQGKVLGKLVGYHDEPHPFSRHEIELAEIVANVVAIAVSRQQSDEARDRALSELGRAQDELRAYHDLVTHDVTNFAGILTGIVDRLLAPAGRTFTPEQEDLLRRAGRQLFQLTRLSENAKNLSRIREKGLAPAGPPVDLCGVIERMAETVRAAHFDRPLEVELECPAELKVSGIPFLESIFLNLFDNIVRHTPGGLTPRVEARASPEDGHVRVTIRGGPPPDEKLLSHLFERYRPGAHSTGSGLSLALIREIVGRAGGEVRVGIAPGPEGKVFEVSLTLPSGG